MGRREERIRQILNHIRSEGYADSYLIDDLEILINSYIVGERSNKQLVKVGNQMIEPVDFEKAAAIAAEMEKLQAEARSRKNLYPPPEHSHSHTHLYKQVKQMSLKEALEARRERRNNT